MYIYLPCNAFRHLFVIFSLMVSSSGRTGAPKRLDSCPFPEPPAFDGSPYSSCSMRFHARCIAPCAAFRCLGGETSMGSGSVGMANSLRGALMQRHAAVLQQHAVCSMRGNISALINQRARASRTGAPAAAMAAAVLLANRPFLDRRRGALLIAFSARPPPASTPSAMSWAARISGSMRQRA